jgi:hypothetical protein
LTGSLPNLNRILFIAETAKGLSFLAKAEASSFSKSPIVAASSAIIVGNYISLKIF